MHRTSREVAARAIICAALGFRASLEVTEHPRAETLCLELLPWLEELGLSEQIESVHCDILRSHHAELPRELQTEAYWRGEAASLLGWAIQLLDKPDATLRVDPAVLVANLAILQSSAAEILSKAELRPITDINDYCAYCIAVRQRLQLAGLAEGDRASLTNIQQKLLDKLGLSASCHRLEEIKFEAATLASTKTSVKGLYVVRAMTAEWLLGAEE